MSKFVMRLPYRVTKSCGILAKVGEIEASQDGLFADTVLELEIFIRFRNTEKGSRVSIAPSWLRYENGKFHREFGGPQWFTMKEIKGLWYTLGALIGQRMEREDIGQPAGKHDL